MIKSAQAIKLLATVTTVSLLSAPILGMADKAKKLDIHIGSDINAFNNPFIQPQDPALSGGGRDQTLQFGDALNGTRKDDLLIGGLGTDVLMGDRGNDVIIGGIEHFNPLNRDRAFGGPGDDIFFWKPGDGSDLWDGGPGRSDAIVFGLTGELVDGDILFNVSFDQQSAEVAIDILQETMICALKTFDQVDSLQYKPYNWLCHLAEQRIIDAHRRYIKAEKRSARLEVRLESPLTASKPGGLIEILAASLTSPTQAIRKDETLRELGLFLDQLPEQQRLALQMRYVEGLPIRVIGEKLGKSSGALRVMLSRTMGKLQNLIYKDDRAS